MWNSFHASLMSSNLSVETSEVELSSLKKSHKNEEKKTYRHQPHRYQHLLIHDLEHSGRRKQLVKTIAPHDLDQTITRVYLQELILET